MLWCKTATFCRRQSVVFSPVRLKLQLLRNVKSGIFVKKRREICWALVIMHCNKALYCMRKLEFLAPRSPCVTILHHNRLYRSSDYISNYIYRTNYRGPVKSDITGFYCMWLLSELGRGEDSGGTNLMITFFQCLAAGYGMDMFRCMASLDRILDPVLGIQSHRRPHRRWTVNIASRLGVRMGMDPSRTYSSWCRNRRSCLDIFRHMTLLPLHLVVNWQIFTDCAVAPALC